MIDHLNMLKLGETLKNNSKRVLKITSTIFLLTLAVTPAYYFYDKYQEAQNKLVNPSAAAKDETKELVVRVGKLIELPVGEEPTVATVSDAEKLKGNPFFQTSQNGDKLLIYPNAKKAYLYRPSADKILDVTTVNIGNGQNAQTQGVAGATDESSSAVEN